MCLCPVEPRRVSQSQYFSTASKWCSCFIVKTSFCFEKRSCISTYSQMRWHNTQQLNSATTNTEPSILIWEKAIFIFRTFSIEHVSYALPQRKEEESTCVFYGGGKCDSRHIEVKVCVFSHRYCRKECCKTVLTSWTSVSHINKPIFIRKLGVISFLIHRVIAF